MMFLIVLLNTFGLTAFIAIWLSMAFVAIGLYKSGKNLDFAISLAKITSIMQYLLLAWFIALGVAWLNADNIVWIFIYILYFVGILILIRKFYGNVISALYNLSKEDGTTMSKQIARKSIEAINLPSQKKTKNKPSLKIFYTFFWILNITISVGAVINAVVNDSQGSSLAENLVMIVSLVLMIQVILLPLMWVVKKVIYSTLGH